jgi:hypothetical protein
MSLARSAARTTMAAPPGGAAVALQAAVEEAQRIGNHARILVILDADRRRHGGVTVERGVGARGHRDLGELAARRAVALHVAARHGRIELRRCDGTERHLELADDAELRHLLHAAADAALRIAVAPHRDQHVVADAGRDGGTCRLDGGDAACPAERRDGREAQGDAEIGDVVLGDHRGERIGDDAVDVLGAKPGIGDGREGGLELQPPHALAGAATIGRLADAGDGALLVQGHSTLPSLHVAAYAETAPSTVTSAPVM